MTPCPGWPQITPLTQRTAGPHSSPSPDDPAHPAASGPHPRLGRAPLLQAARDFDQFKLPLSDRSNERIAFRCGRDAHVCAVADEESTLRPPLKSVERPVERVGVLLLEQLVGAAERAGPEEPPM